MHAHAVGDMDRLVRVVQADVHVLAEDDLLARDEAQRADQVAIARARDDPLVLPHRERVRPGRADHQVAARSRLVDLPAQRPQLLPGLDGELVDLPNAERVGSRALAKRLVDRLRGHAEDLGSGAELDGIQDLIDRGNGAARQIVVYEANHDLREVMSEIVTATAE